MNGKSFFWQLYPSYLLVIIVTAGAALWYNSHPKNIYLFVVAAIIILLFTAVMSWLVARYFSRPLMEIRQGVSQFTAGDFTHKLLISGPQQMVDLADAMNRMGGQAHNSMQAVIRQRNELKAVFFSMSTGVLVFDMDEKFISVNQAGANLINVDVDAVAGKHLLEVIRNSKLQQFVTQTLSSRKIVEGEFALTDINGERYFQVHGVRLQAVGEQASGGLVVISDITRLLRLEKVRRDFVANVSHELKTPITAIQGFVETLLDGAKDDPKIAERFLNIINRQTNRLHAIVENLLVLSKIEQKTKNNEINLTSHRLKDLLLTAIQFCAVQAVEKNMDIVVKCPDTLHVAINQPLFVQAIINLIDNGIKYSPAKSRLTVKARQDGAAVIIEVRDNGVGIAKKHHPRIFERFYRVDPARSRKQGGTGLGLAIVKHIVQAHNGQVTVDSVPGQGAVFIIKLPAI